MSEDSRQKEHRGDLGLGVALIIRRGVVKPGFSELGHLKGKDKAITDIANAIIDLTRSNVL